MSVSPRLSAFTIIVSFLCVALVGLALLPLLPLKLSPSRTLPMLTVHYTMPNHSSRVIEQEVTSRLEAMLARIKGIKEIRSTSGNGWGSIRLELDKHTAIDAARFEASTIIRQTWPRLPEALTYPTIEMSRPDDKESHPFLSYTLNAPASPAFIQQLAEERIRPRLANIPGIYRIEISGASPMEWRLEYDSRQLAQLELSVETLRDAISDYYEKEFLGIARLSDGAEGGEWIRLALLPDKTGETGFDPARITVTNRAGKLIRLDQLLQVSHREADPQNYYRINGLNSVYLSLRAEETANQLRLATTVKQEMERLHSLLPAGYEVHTSYDATEFIREELHKIYIRTGLTILILLLFVLLVTRNARYLLLIVISLGMNLCIAVIFYYLLGLEMQLYSLAGITLSLSLVIDNTIVMADHIRHHHDRRAFLAILAATLTTMGALAIIFFLDERIRLNLQDFAVVVIINLAVSLLVALFLVPALLEKLGLERIGKQPDGTRPAGHLRTVLHRIGRRLPVYFTHYYQWQIRSLCHWRKSACLVALLTFGIPIFLLPEKIEPDEKAQWTPADSLWADRYNRVMSSPTYKEKVKPILDKVLGGTLRLFVEKVYDGSYFTRNDETVLSVSASLPNGSTLPQMNSLIGKMEQYLTTFDGIRQFQTHIYNARQAGINIYFTRESVRSGFPYTLKSKIISKALELGGGSWNVWGLQDQGFSNDLRENAGSFRIEMYGYNYDALYQWAEQLKDSLLTYRRIKEVTIDSEFSWWKDDYQAYFFLPDKRRMAEAGLFPADLFGALHNTFGKDIYSGTILTGTTPEKLKLTSRQAEVYDLWSLRHQMQQTADGKRFRLSALATIEKGQMPRQVAKVDQQYRLCLQYEYIGASTQGTKIQQRILRRFKQLLPMGYTARTVEYSWGWGEKERGQYALLLLVIAIIFFTTAILFNSLRQPLAVIGVIPLSYIGVFLTFYLFKLNFDQGGFAAFVLLCGITVNASIYILNEYNRQRNGNPRLTPIRAYLKAWNAKITPIFLTVISTILGFIPFLLGADKEAFWFPLAAGTIGGLAMSLLGIFLYLPLFTLPRKAR